MDLSGLSITELKQMLARVNHDLKMNKPTMSRAAKKASKAVAPIISEYAECNIIAQRFTKKQYNQPIQNAKIIADIQIQRDILDFIHNGGQIITRKSRKKIKPLTISNKIISL